MGAKKSRFQLQSSGGRHRAIDTMDGNKVLCFDSSKSVVQGFLRTLRRTERSENKKAKEEMRAVD